MPEIDDRGSSASGGITQAAGDARYLRILQNLADVNSAATALANLGGAPLASPTFTGTPAAPTPAGGTNTTQIATTAFVVASFAPLASPALTGNPTLPTQAALTNSTRAASTAYTDAAVTADNTAVKTLTNKRITRRVSAVAGPGATPSMNTDNFDQFDFTALAAAITSMTTNLTGTPVAGDRLIITFTDNGTARAITYGAKFVNRALTAPVTTVISTRLTTGWLWNDVAATWDFMGSA